MILNKDLVNKKTPKFRGFFVAVGFGYIPKS